LLHIPHKGRQPKRYKSSREPSKKVRQGITTTLNNNQTDKEMQCKVQDVTENSNNDQINMLQDSEKR
ncbi:24146_t:CDS:1, partial [Cetraspora pellucida]